MRTGRLLLPLLALAALAGCAANDDESSSGGGGGGPDQDAGLIGVQYVDVTAPLASDCMGEGARSVPSAEFELPEGATWVRIEGSFPSGRVGLDVSRDDGRRVGFASGSTPVVVVVEEASLEGATKLVVKAYACEGDADLRVRVFATFRRAAP